MKTKLLSVPFMLLLLTTSLYAAPEYKTLRPDEARIKQKIGKEAISYLDTSSIQDPAAREAIEHILTYLGLSHVQSAAFDLQVKQEAAERKALRTQLQSQLKEKPSPDKNKKGAK